jgi:hypothetical protein
VSVRWGGKPIRGTATGGCRPAVGAALGRASTPGSVARRPGRSGSAHRGRSRPCRNTGPSPASSHPGRVDERNDAQGRNLSPAPPRCRDRLPDQSRGEEWGLVAEEGTHPRTGPVVPHIFRPRADPECVGAGCEQDQAPARGYKLSRPRFLPAVMPVGKGQCPRVGPVGKAPEHPTPASRIDQGPLHVKREALPARHGVVDWKCLPVFLARGGVVSR